MAEKNRHPVGAPTRPLDAMAAAPWTETPVVLEAGADARDRLAATLFREAFSACVAWNAVGHAFRLAKRALRTLPGTGAALLLSKLVEGSDRVSWAGGMTSRMYQARRPHAYSVAIEAVALLAYVAYAVCVCRAVTSGVFRKRPPVVTLPIALAAAAVASYGSHTPSLDLAALFAAWAAALQLRRLTRLLVVQAAWLPAWVVLYELTQAYAR